MKWIYTRKDEYDFFQSPDGLRFVVHYSGLVYLPAAVHRLGEAYALAAIAPHYVQPVQDEDGIQYVDGNWLAEQRHNEDQRMTIEGAISACRRIWAEELINRPFREQWLREHQRDDLLELLNRRDDEEDSAPVPHLYCS